MIPNNWRIVQRSGKIYLHADGLTPVWIVSYTCKHIGLHLYDEDDTEYYLTRDTQGTKERDYNFYVSFMVWNCITRYNYMRNKLAYQLEQSRHSAGSVSAAPRSFRPSARIVLTAAARRGSSVNLIA
jgi:hypothetical protein